MGVPRISLILHSGFRLSAAITTGSRSTIELQGNKNKIKIQKVINKP
jgi:hypothetical protein